MAGGFFLSMGKWLFDRHTQNKMDERVEEIGEKYRKYMNKNGERVEDPRERESERRKDLARRIENLENVGSGSLLRNKEITPDLVIKHFIDYILMIESTPLGLVFKYHDIDDGNLIHKENTESRDVYLLRNHDRLAVKQVDGKGETVFYSEKDLNHSDGDPKVIRAMHQLYVEELAS